MSDKKKAAKSPKSAKSGSSSVKDKDKDVRKFPVSQVDYTQPVIVKNSKVSFDEKLGIVKERHKDRLDDLILEMESVKKENERLRRQQEDTFGISVDTVDRMKKELERARTTRMFLQEDINIRKAKSERMEADIFELNMKLESFQKKINEYNKMKKEWEETSDKLMKVEEKCDKLSKVNKNLRMLLMKHHIDPKTVDFDNERKATALSEKPPSKSILKPTLKKKPDAHALSHSNVYMNNAKKQHQATEEVQRPSAEIEKMRRKNIITTRQVMGRGPPAYLGYYTNIHQNRITGKAKVDTLHLPRIAVM